MTDGVRRLSHEDAEMLISARMDEQLDRADSRALLVHLQSCESCRAFAVQSEVLGRELAALPVLPPSAIVDRRIRESIAKKSPRWSVGSLFPASGGNGGLRTAVGALAMLTLVSVFLLVRMAGDQNGEGPPIEAPNGGVAQQLESTTTADATGDNDETIVGPTETARVVVPPTQPADETDISAPTQSAQADSTSATEVPTGETDLAQVEPTRTLDSSYVYPIDKTRTPAAGSTRAATGVPSASVPAEPTEPSGDIAIAAAGIDEGTPVEAVADTTEEPATAAAEPSTQEPAATESPVVISVDPTQPPDESTVEPPVDETISTDEPAEGTEEPSQAAGTAATSQAGAADTPRDEEDAPAPSPESPANTETPTEPFTQPTIAPMAGDSSDAQEGGEDSSSEAVTAAGNDVPPIVPSNDQPVDDSGDGEGDAGIEATGSDGSPPIVASDGTAITEGVGAASDGGVGGETQPPAIPTAAESAEPFGLDLADTVTALSSGTSSPPGRLEFSPGMSLYVVTSPDGQLAVADLEGELVVTLGAGELPVWAGSGLMFCAHIDSGVSVGIWNSDSGEIRYIAPDEEEASSDVPIGGDGSTFYYLRTYPDRPGAMEIRSTTIDGEDMGSIWSSESTMLGGMRPLWNHANGSILLPTDTSWLQISLDGTETELGDNPYGYIGAPILSPGGGLLAYSAEDQVIVAWTTDPGTPSSTAPFGEGFGGYAFATSGEEIVVSDGTTLHVISYDGSELGTLDGTRPVGGCYWVSDTIYFLQIGEEAALRSTSLGAIQEG